LPLTQTLTFGPLRLTALCADQKITTKKLVDAAAASV